jgi:hypothetical protein
VVAAMVALPRPAQAQRQGRPFRLLLGLSAPKEHRTSASGDIFGGAYSDRTSAGALHLAYDLPVDLSQGRQASRLPPLILSAYFDSASYADDAPSPSAGSGIALPSFNIQTTEAYQGFGAMLRAPYSWGYAGAGLGLYKGGVGGKVFVGLQGRGSVFAELSWTLLSRPGVAGNPYPVLGLGIRL